MPMKGERKIFIFASNSGLVAFFAVHGARALQGIEGKADSAYIAVFFMDRP